MKLPLPSSIRLFLTGAAMGLADLIPGVSGGTIAFLSGIYEELLQSIKIVSGQTLKLLLQGQFTAAIKSVPWQFLLPLVLGLATALFSLAHIVSWLLANYPIFVWAFFFGLVLASTGVVLKRVVRWDISDIISFAVAAIAAYFIVGATPTTTPDNLPFIFVSGAIAISAMILPGISGSFILLLLGQYQNILAAVTQRDFVTLGVFILGCIVGLSLFARVLTWLFSRYHDISIAILAGLMLGSIRKIWPWQEIVANSEINVLPAQFSASVAVALLLAALAAALVYYLDRLILPPGAG